MAEEDIMFGKTRHLFGGIEPSNMLIFNVVKRSGVVTIVAELPKDSIVNGQSLCSVEGAVIRRKTTGYPTDEFDGDLAMDITSSGTFADSGANVDTTYYYAAFPYTTQGVYNRNEANISKYIPNDSTHYYFGYDLDIADSDPATRVSYPSDVDNVGFTPAGLSSSTFSYGSWPSTAGVKFMPKPCLVYNTGGVYQYLNQNDYTKKTDGTNSDVTNTSLDINAMMEWPKIYTHREVVNGVYKFRCSDTKQGDDWDCWCNYDKNNNEIDHFYTSIYACGLVSSKLRSISGLGLSYYTTSTNIIGPATANGSDWYTEVIADRLLINDLLVMMAKTTDCQTAFGKGDVMVSSTLSGSMNTRGLFATYGGRVKIFGMEDWWNCSTNPTFYRYVSGWVCDAGVQKVKITRGTHDGSTASDYNLTGEGYLALANSTPSGTSGGYISSMTTKQFGRFPVIANGSSTTYECDSFTFNNTYNYAAFPGFDGPFGTKIANITKMYSYLSYKPLAE